MLSHPFLIQEYKDTNFLCNIPNISKENEEFYNYRINLVKKYEKVKNIINEFNLIEENKNLDDELKRNDEEMINLMKNENDLRKQYDNYLKNFTNDINKSMKANTNKNKLYNNKLKFLEIQIKNDLFNIKYYGYIDEENKKSDESNSNCSSSSSNEEDNESK